MRDYQRQWKDARRIAYFADKACVRCGSTEDLQLDHIDPRQKVDHKIWTWSYERRVAELAKCQVLCAPCHKIKTAEDRFPDHGTIGRYKRGCKCVECKAANARRVARQRLC